MSFIDTIIEKAQASPGRILLPEPEDERTLRAADALLEQGIANVVLVGSKDVVAGKQAELGITRDFEIVDPADAEWRDDFNQTFFEMRKKKGITEEAAAETMGDAIPHGIMMLQKGMGDGLVAGACHSTGDTLRPALQILRTSEGVSLVSSFFFMVVGETVYMFADCALVEDPNSQQLAEIALTTAQSALAFSIEPKVAMLSYSTKGSANSPLTQKVVEATQIARERAAEMFSAESGVEIDGELQLDAAIVESVGSSKAPGSSVAGSARILVFPELNSGNIGYKLVQRMAGAEAYGPILQGIRKPVKDLSRGCSWEDIFGVAAITSVQGQMARSNE